MTITLLSSKPRMFSTVLDVVTMASLIKTESLNFDINDDQDFNSPKIMRDTEVESYIQRADSIIDSYLKSQYSSPSGLIIESWAGATRHRIQNSVDKNKLVGISVLQTSGYTSHYTVEFTSATAFSVRSSLESSQGSGTISSDFTTSNGVVKIGTNSWDSSITVVKGDEYYFSIIDRYKMVHTISCMLSASMILSERYSEQIPNENVYPRSLWKRGMEFLNKLSDPDDSLSLQEEADNLTETTPIDYNISTTGEDQSSYLTENDLDI